MKNLLAIAVAILLTGQAAAETSLCTEQVKTGFGWNNGAWKPKEFPTVQWIVREIAAQEPGFKVCDREVESRGGRTPVTNGVVTSSWSCYAVYEPAASAGKFNTSACKVYWDQGKHSSVYCEKLLFERIDFYVGGKFTMEFSPNAPLGDSMIKPDDKGRNSWISLGRCSVIAP